MPALLVATANYYMQTNETGEKVVHAELQVSEGCDKAQAFCASYLSILTQNEKERGEVLNRAYIRKKQACFSAKFSDRAQVIRSRCPASGSGSNQGDSLRNPFPGGKYVGALPYTKADGSQINDSDRRSIYPLTFEAMNNTRLISTAFAMMVFTAASFSSLFGQGSYMGPESILHPSQEAAYNHILIPSSVDTIAITAQETKHIGNAQFVYLLEDQAQGARMVELDASEQIYLVEDLSGHRIAVRFGAFHTSHIEVRMYNEDRKLVFWKQKNEVFSGEQIVVDYDAFEGGKYFLHVNTNDGPVIKQHLYKPYQAYTAAN